MQDDYANFLDQLQIPDPTVGVVGWLDEAGLNAGGAAVCTTDPQNLAVHQLLIFLVEIQQQKR